MQLSVLDLAPVYAEASPREALEQSVVLAQTVERLGYSRYWVAEHHDMASLACTAPEILLAHIGARTKRIRLGTGALLLPHYKPLKVAETFHMLASLYPGRIDLGIGRAPGGSAHVTMALSGNFLENVRRMPDLLQDLSNLLLGNYRVDDVPVTARPIPPVPPELWLLGTNRKSASFAAELGTAYVFGQFMSDTDASDVLSVYRNQFRPSRHLPEPKAMVAVGAVCADSEEEAGRLAARGMAVFAPESDAQPGAASTPSGRLLAGEAEHVKKQLEQLSQRLGVDEFLLITMVPDYRKRLRSFELLADAMFDGA